MFSFMTKSAPAVRRITPAEAVARAEKGEITVIDVREHGEVSASGKARDALHVPLMLLAMRCDPRSPEFLAGLDPEKPVAVYCASGGRSQRACDLLAGMGYGEVYNIGGLCDWHAAGGPVTR